MTVTDEAPPLEGVEETPAETTAPESTDNGEDDSKGKDRDFSKVRQLHIDLACYVNEHSGLEPISANQVKALLYLRGDFNDSPERQAARAAKKAQRDAEAKKYEGMSDDQIKRHKQASKAQEAAERADKRAKEAKERADKLLKEAEGGEDIAGQVESVQNGVESPDPLTADPEGLSDAKPKRGINRRR
jgi:hypothetical protein